MTWDDLPEPVVGLIVVCGIVLFAVLVAWGAVSLDDYAKDRALKRFEDCIARDNEPEWCFRLGDP